MSRSIIIAVLLGMFDQDHSGTIDIYEFEKLFNYINQWLNVFKSYDRDQSGSIEEAELLQGKLNCYTLYYMYRASLLF